MKYQCPPGMKDLVSEAALFRKLENDFMETLLNSGFQEIRTPMLEAKELFCRSVGEESDIVSKEMFETLDGLVLRPENTAAIMRAVVANQSLIPSNLCYFAPQFRKERPQKGRLRQFYQYGFELIGEAAPEAEIKSLILINQLFAKWNLSQYEIQVNYLGNTEDRKKYLSVLTKFLQDNKNSLSVKSQSRLTGNVLRILDSKEELDVALLKSAPKILDYLGPESQKEWQLFLELAQLAKIKLTINPYLVRGLDYYTGVVLEVVDLSNNLGSQNALGGGGRYDGLSQALGGPALSAFGFAGGVERLILALNLSEIKTNSEKIGLISNEAETIPLFMELKNKFATLNIDINFNYTLGFKKMFKRADKINCTKVVIYGSNEREQGIVKIKDMKTGTETIVSGRLLDLDLSTLG